MARIAHSHRPLDERDQTCTICYMQTHSSVEIAAPASLVWYVFSDVERWPEWTASVPRLVALDGPGLAVGKRFEIKQPRMPKLVWEVTEVNPAPAGPGCNDPRAAARLPRATMWSRRPTVTRSFGSSSTNAAQSARSSAGSCTG